MIRSTLVSARTSRFGDSTPRRDGAELGLAGGFFAGDVEDLARHQRRHASRPASALRRLRRESCFEPVSPVLPRQRVRHLQQQRRLADPRLAADEHRRARHDAAAEDAVELADAGRLARRVGLVDLGERAAPAPPLGEVAGLRCRARASRDAAAGVRRRGLVLLERCPTCRSPGTCPSTSGGRCRRSCRGTGSWIWPSIVCSNLRGGRPACQSRRRCR